jgi:tape measure domain-containing protein
MPPERRGCSNSMADNNEVKVTIRGDARSLREALRQVSQRVTDMETRTKAALKPYQGLKTAAVAAGGALAGLAATMGIATIAAAKLAEGIRRVSDVAAKFEGMQMSFETLTGSVGVAQEMIRSIRELSAASGISADVLGNAQRALLSFGVSAGVVREDMRTLAEISVATGADLQGLALAFGQVQAKGRLMGEETLQFAERGISLMNLLAESTGKSTRELVEMQKRGEISFDMVRQALQRMTAEGGQAFGAIERYQATTQGVASALNAQYQETARILGERVNPALNRYRAALTDVLKVLNDEGFTSQIGAMTDAIAKATEGAIYYQGVTQKASYVVGQLIGAFKRVKDEQKEINEASEKQIESAEKKLEALRKEEALQGRLRDLQANNARLERLREQQRETMFDAMSVEQLRVQYEELNSTITELMDQSVPEMDQLGEFVNRVEQRVALEVQREDIQKRINKLVNDEATARKKEADELREAVQLSWTKNDTMKEWEEGAREERLAREESIRASEVEIQILRERIKLEEVSRKGSRKDIEAQEKVVEELEKQEAIRQRIEQLVSQHVDRETARVMAEKEITEQLRLQNLERERSNQIQGVGGRLIGPEREQQRIDRLQEQLDREVARGRGEGPRAESLRRRQERAEQRIAESQEREARRAGQAEREAREREARIAKSRERDEALQKSREERIAADEERQRRRESSDTTAQAREDTQRQAEEVSRTAQSPQQQMAGAVEKIKEMLGQHLEVTQRWTEKVTAS